MSVITLEKWLIDCFYSTDYYDILYTLFLYYTCMHTLYRCTYITVLAMHWGVSCLTRAFITTIAVLRKREKDSKKFLLRVSLYLNWCPYANTRASHIDVDCLEELHKMQTNRQMQHLHFDSHHWNCSWNWSEKAKKKFCAEMLHISMLCKEKHLVATVKYGDGLVMLGAILWLSVNGLV